VSEWLTDFDAITAKTMLVNLFKFLP